MEKKVLNEILSMDKQELRNLVEEQGNKIDLGIYLTSIWDSVGDISRTYPNIRGSFLKIAQIFRKYDWDIRKYLNKRMEYKYFQEKNINERKKIIISDYIFRLNPILKVIDYYEYYNEKENALQVSVILEGNQMIWVDMIDISNLIDEILDSISEIEIETFKIYQILH